MAQLKKILLVDDDDDLREALSEQLVITEDFDVFEAGDGHDALIKAKEALYDLVILDVGLPGMNGRQLAEIAIDKRPGLKVLFVTGYAEQAVVRNGFLGENMQMITKPFVINELANQIRAMLQDEMIPRPR